MQDLELRKRTWRDFVTSTRSAGDPDMRALLDADIRPRDLDAAFATICLNEDVEFPAGEADSPDPPGRAEGTRQVLEGAAETPAVGHRPRRRRARFRRPRASSAGNFDVSRFRLDRPSVMASLLHTWKCESKIIQKWWADSPAQKKRLRDLINPLHEEFCTDTVTPYLSQWRQYVYRLSVTLLTQAREHAARRAPPTGRAELRRPADPDGACVTREHGLSATRLQQKYRHLFVDEFQDTDPVQAEIVFLLAAAESYIAKPASAVSPETGADWRTIALRPGALFVVGDPKQSIYRFRRADIDIYNIVRDRFSDPAVGLVLPLTMNFRSVPSLCNWANEVFKTRIPRGADEPFTPVRGARREREQHRTWDVLHTDAHL